VQLVQRRNLNMAAPRSAFAAFVIAGATGAMLTVASVCCLAAPEPGDTDGSFAAVAQSAVHANEARVTIIADATTTPAAARESIKPQYPEEARRDGIEGYVVVQFDISRTGAVSDARVIEAQPANYFETAAINAVRQYQFSPTANSVEPVAIRGAVNKFVFSLHAPNTPVNPGSIRYRGRTYYAVAE
jgi:TonB family protein